MISTTMHRMLAKVGEGFGSSLFVRQDLEQLIAESLDETKRWQKRDCPLTAPFVVFFVLSMALSRSLSIKSQRLEELANELDALDPPHGLGR